MFNKLRLLTPGPTPLPEKVRLALARDMIHHRKQEFKDIMFAVQEKLRQLFGTQGPVLPLSSSGTGAMTAAVYGLFNPGEKVLVLEAGKFGQRWREIATSRGLEVQSVEIEWGKAADPQLIADILANDPSIKGVLLQMCETSTGVLNPIEQIARITAASDTLLVVDGISAVGISPCPMDEWQIDCLLTGSQKGLMLPPGLALLALSERAWQKVDKVKPGCFYFNLAGEKKNVEKGQTLFTTPVNLIVGLNASLELLFENGLDAIYKKQWAMTMLVREGAKAMGLEMLAKQNYSWGVTAIKLPAGVDGQQTIKIAQDRYGVCMAGGQDSLKGKIVRIGHMGWVDWADCLAGLYALNRGLFESGGYSASRDYLEVAMSAYLQALAGKPGELPDSAKVRS